MFATCYNNIGLVYRNMEDYLKALAYHEQAFETGQRSLNTNHPDLQLYKDNLEFVKTNLNIE
jgi:tetratricopeptide (TPR) repeat protein